MHASQIQNILWQNIHEGIHFKVTKHHLILNYQIQNYHFAVDSFFFWQQNVSDLP